MARPPRADGPGCWHHVMNRGARREPIFRRDEHCEIFLTLLGEACRRHGVEVHAYSLMPNHFHLLVRSKRGKLSQAMQELGARYTQILNKRYGWDGPLFRGRFRSQLVHHAPSLEHVFAYIHLNPLRARLARDVEDDCWTSLLAYLGLAKRPSWLTVSAFSKALGGPAGIRRLIERRRKRPEEWPEGFDLETGRFALEAAPLRAKQVDLPFGRETRASVPIGDVLAAVCAAAECTLTDLRRAGAGRRANLRRWFAVWALSREHGYSCGEIGHALGMRPNDVWAVRHTLRTRSASPQLRVWMDALGEDE